MLSDVGEESQAIIPSISTGPPFHFPMSSLVYFQFVFAAITPILALGSVLGRVNFKAWIPYVAIWITVVYTVNAFLIWGGGYWAAHGALDYSGGYVIHLAAGISGFVFAAVIGPRLQRDREIDAPNNLLMVACGAGILWLGWNGFNGGDSYYAGNNASAAVLNTNVCTAVAMMVWIAWDYIFREKPSLIGAVNGMISGLVGITPAAGFVNGWGAIIIGVTVSTIVWMSIRFLSRAPMFRHVDDTLGVIYTHGIAGFCGGLLVGLVANDHMIEYFPVKNSGALPNFAGLFYGGGWTLLRWQFETGAVGDRVHGDHDLHHPQADRHIRAVEALRRGAGDRRSRDPRQRGLPLGRAYARGPSRSDMGARRRPAARRRWSLGANPSPSEPERLPHGRSGNGSTSAAAPRSSRGRSRLGDVSGWWCRPPADGGCQGPDRGSRPRRSSRPSGPPGAASLAVPVGRLTRARKLEAQRRRIRRQGEGSG